MAVPSYDSLYIPVLAALKNDKVLTNRDFLNLLSVELNLSEEDLKSSLSSGKNVLRDRINWACTYLRKAGLIQRVSRGHYQITAEGKAVIENPPAVLDNHFLCQYPSFVEFTSTKPTPASEGSPVVAENKETPNDQIEQAIISLNQQLSDDLLSEIMDREPTFFENLVVKLLIKMGYGGSSMDSGFVTQRSNDGGIDGIIREDKLGFDQIYIQAKRWDPNTTVSRPEIQKFSGALRDEGASKGLFITTAKFSEGARKSAERQHIVLVDGVRLTKLMIEYNLGVSPVAKYEIKTIDTDFFNEEID